MCLRPRLKIAPASTVAHGAPPKFVLAVEPGWIATDLPDVVATGKEVHGAKPAGANEFRQWTPWSDTVIPSFAERKRVSS